MGQMGQEKSKKGVVREYLKSGKTLREYGGEKGISASTLHRWVRAYERGEDLGGVARRRVGIEEAREMPGEVKRLRRELTEARLHNELLNAMIDIAESEMGVEIRKKRGAKRR